MVTHKLHLVLAQSPWLELVNDCTTKYQLQSDTNITFGTHELRNWGWSLSTLLKFNIFTCLIVFWRWLISGWNYQSSIIADQQAWGWLSLPTALFPSQSVCCTGAPATGSVSFFCWGCESVRGIICPRWFTQFPAPLGPKMATQKIPRAREPPRLFSSIAELNSGGFPERQDSNTSAHHHQFIHIFDKRLSQYTH